MYILIIIMREYHENIFWQKSAKFSRYNEMHFNTCTSISMVLGKAANNIANALEILQSCTKPLISNAMIIASFTQTLTLTFVMLNFTAGKWKYIGILYDFLKLRMRHGISDISRNHLSCKANTINSYDLSLGISRLSASIVLTQSVQNIWLQHKKV